MHRARMSQSPTAFFVALAPCPEARYRDNLFNQIQRKDPCWPNQRIGPLLDETPPKIKRKQTNRPQAVSSPPTPPYGGLGGGLLPICSYPDCFLGREWSLWCLAGEKCRVSMPMFVYVFGPNRGRGARGRVRFQHAVPFLWTFRWKGLFPSTDVCRSHRPEA